MILTEFVRFRKTCFALVAIFEDKEKGLSPKPFIVWINNHVNHLILLILSGDTFKLILSGDTF